MIYVFLGTGFEEVEAIAPVDLLRRCALDVKLVSIMGTPVVESAHGINVKADALFEECDFSDAELVILPGGQPGTSNLLAHAGVKEVLLKQDTDGKRIAAICAAPTVLGAHGLLQGKKATCYPGCEDGLTGAVITDQKVVTDGNITTSQGPGTAIDFGLELASLLCGKEAADSVAKDYIYA